MGPLLAFSFPKFEKLLFSAPKWYTFGIFLAFRSEHLNLQLLTSNLLDQKIEQDCSYQGEALKVPTAF